MNPKDPVSMKPKNRVTDLTFDELVELATQHIHSALLEGGGKEMKGAIYTWMSRAIGWSQNQK